MQNVNPAMRSQHWDGSSKSTYYEQRDGWGGGNLKRSKNDRCPISLERDGGLNSLPVVFISSYHLSKWV